MTPDTSRGGRARLDDDEDQWLSNSALGPCLFFALSQAIAGDEGAWRTHKQDIIDQLATFHDDDWHPWARDLPM